MRAQMTHTAFPCSIYVHAPCQRQVYLIDHLTELGNVRCATLRTVAEDVKATVEVNELSPDISMCVEKCAQCLRTGTGLLAVRACFEGLKYIEEGLDLCNTASSLDYIFVVNQLKSISKAAQDLLVIRAQMLCPTGERREFVDVVEAWLTDRHTDRQTDRQIDRQTD